MNINNFYCAVACIVICFGMSGFSLSPYTVKDGFNATKCTNHEQCNKVCFKGEFLNSRCDPNGTCICDCNDQSQIPSAYTSACEIKQPDGPLRDYCDSYCTEVYRRPCRYCNDSGNYYCTCVCNKNPTL